MKPSLVFSALALVSTSVAADDPVSLGPLGGAATSVVVDADDPSILHVTKYDGLYRSTDGGASFVLVSSVPSSANDLTLDPKDSDRVLCAADDAVYESLDSGQTWSPLGVVASGIRDLAVASSGPNLLASTSDAVYHSSDGGQAWVQVASGVLITPVAFAPSDPTIAYFGTIDDVHRSTDGGLTWTNLANLDEWIKDLAISATDPDLLFAGTGGGPYRSQDGGATWTSVNAGLPFFPSVQVIAFEPGGARVWMGLLDSMWFSNDLGTTWNAANAGFPPQPPIPLDITFDGGDIFLAMEASNGGLWRTEGGGPPWVHVGFADQDVHDVLVGGPDGDRAAASFNGIFAGPKGQTLSSTVFQADFGTHTEVLTVDPSDPDRWLAGGVGAFIDNAQIVVLDNGGASAAMTYTQFGAGTVVEIAFDPLDPTRVLAGMLPGGFGNEAVVRSTDAGATWSDVPGTAGWATRAIAWDPHTPGRVLQLSDNNQWAESLDGGATWGGLQPAWPGTGPGMLLAFDPFVPGTLYRGDEGLGLQKSVDGGATWTQLGVTLHRRSDLELSSESPGLFYVSDADGQLRASGDGGASFISLFSAPAEGDVSGIAVDAADGTIVVGTTRAGSWDLPCAAPYVTLGPGTAGAGGFEPQHFGVGLPRVGTTFSLGGDGFVGGGVAVIGVGLFDISLPFAGGLLFPGPPYVLTAGVVGGGPSGAPGLGNFVLPVAIPSTPSLVGVGVVSQYGLADPGAADPSGLVLSEGLLVRVLP